MYLHEKFNKKSPIFNRKYKSGQRRIIEIIMRDRVGNEKDAGLNMVRSKLINVGRKCSGQLNPRGVKCIREHYIMSYTKHIIQSSSAPTIISGLCRMISVDL